MNYLDESKPLNVCVYINIADGSSIQLRHSFIEGDHYQPDLKLALECENIGEYLIETGLVKLKPGQCYKNEGEIEYHMITLEEHNNQLLAIKMMDSQGQGDLYLQDMPEEFQNKIETEIAKSSTEFWQGDVFKKGPGGEYVDDFDGEKYNPDSPGEHFNINEGEVDIKISITWHDVGERYEEEWQN